MAILAFFLSVEADLNDIRLLRSKKKAVYASMLLNLSNVGILSRVGKSIEIEETSWFKYLFSI